MNNYILQGMILVAKIMFPKYATIPNKTIIAQALLESANYKSKIYKEGNNLFGMKKPRIRKFWGNGENRGHATYATPMHSVIDYFQRINAFPKSWAASNGDYYDFLKRTGYAEPQPDGTPTYLQRLQRVEQSLKHEYVLPVLVVGIGFFLSAINL